MIANLGTPYELDSAHRGYKESRPGAARFVFLHPKSPDLYLVVKVFDTGKGLAQWGELSTAKVWKTRKLNEDKLKWKSTEFRFDPSEEERNRALEIGINHLKDWLKVS